MNYTVEIAPRAQKAIVEAARYIAEDQAAPFNADNWLEGLLDAIFSLRQMPRRWNIAAEDKHRAKYEIRKLIYGDYLVLFMVNDERRMVSVIGFRHGSRRPRSEDLPPELRL
jgi:plasmid stabilization system protein ParE